MTTILPRLLAPFSTFTDTAGDPLDGGFLYYGEDNLDPQNNPIDVYFDEEGTVPAAQPIRTSGGRPYYLGAPANIYIDQENYSITILDKNSNLVLTSLHNHIDDDQSDINTLQEEIDILQISDTIFDTSGGPSAYNVITGLSEIVTGSLIWVRFNVSADTDGATITVDALTPPGTVAIHKIDETGSSVPIPQEEITQGTESQLYYDGTNWLVVNTRYQVSSFTNFGITRPATLSEVLEGTDSNTFISPVNFLRAPDSIFYYSVAGGSGVTPWGLISGDIYFAPINFQQKDLIGITLSSNTLEFPIGTYYIRAFFNVGLNTLTSLSGSTDSGLNDINFESFFFNITDSNNFGYSVPSFVSLSNTYSNLGASATMQIFNSNTVSIDMAITAVFSEVTVIDIRGFIEDDPLGIAIPYYPSGVSFSTINSIRNNISIWKL